MQRLSYFISACKVTISERAKKILQVLAAGEALSRANIEKATSETRITTMRELNHLVAQGLVATSGEARSTVYAITEHTRGVLLWDVEEYLAEDPDKRHARYTRLEPELLKTGKGMIGQPAKDVINLLCLLLFVSLLVRSPPWFFTRRFSFAISSSWKLATSFRTQVQRRHACSSG